MITNNQNSVVVYTIPKDAIEELKKLKNTHPFRGTGYGFIGFNDGEVITSFEGIGFPTWEDDKDQTKKGTYIVVSFNNKKIALNSFVKDKYLLKPSGELIPWKQAEGFTKFISEHPIRPDMTDNEFLAVITAYNTECQRLVSVGAKFSAVYDVSVQGGYPHRVGKFSIIG